MDDDILSRRDTLVPLFQELDIDVVLMGHDHVYTRSYMMDGLTPMTDASIYDSENYDSITDPEGILYVRQIPAPVLSSITFPVRIPTPPCKIRKKCPTSPM
ncbi:MAG: hypothetical protein ACLVHV_09875 [Oscillospiraceae bacterium]